MLNNVYGVWCTRWIQRIILNFCLLQYTLIVVTKLSQGIETSTISYVIKDFVCQTEETRGLGVLKRLDKITPLNPIVFLKGP